MAEAVAHALNTTFETLGGDLRAIYASAAGYSVSSWVTEQQAAVGIAGGAAMVVPGAHLLAAAADVGFLLNRMHACSYGVGAILGREAGRGDILEPEDFGNVLAHWAGALDFNSDLRGVVVGKVLVDAGVKVGGKVGAKLVGKAIAQAGGVLVGKKLGSKVAAKAAAKFAGKLAGKVGAGFVPFLGAAVSAGINVWFVDAISESAKEYYRFKLSL
jgi:hypothetical protein